MQSLNLFLVWQVYYSLTSTKFQSCVRGFAISEATWYLRDCISNFFKGAPLKVKNTVVFLNQMNFRLSITQVISNWYIWRYNKRTAKYFLLPSVYFRMILLCEKVSWKGYILMITWPILVTMIWLDFFLWSTTALMWQVLNGLTLYIDRKVKSSCGNGKFTILATKKVADFLWGTEFKYSHQITSDAEDSYQTFITVGQNIVLFSITCSVSFKFNRACTFKTVLSKRPNV